MCLDSRAAHTRGGSRRAGSVGYCQTRASGITASLGLRTPERQHEPMLSPSEDEENGGNRHAQHDRNDGGFDTERAASQEVWTAECAAQEPARRLPPRVCAARESRHITDVTRIDIRPTRACH